MHNTIHLELKSNDAKRVDLPDTICFRVTRYCNARCGFCLAPPDGSNPAADRLTTRLEWLLSHGVRTIDFCGGEPTIHKALPQLIEYVNIRGGKTKLTTNGIAVSDTLLEVLRAVRCKVKVSLHGDRQYHNEIVGCDAFDNTTNNLRRILAAGIPTSVQTTVVARRTWVVDWVADFCLEVGVRRLSIMPFIPRGSGYGRRGDYGLSDSERRALHALVIRKRRELNGRLDVRWLDFTARPIHVVEPDGRLVLERATEAMDEIICRIPDDPIAK